MSLFLNLSLFVVTIISVISSAQASTNDNITADTPIRFAKGQISSTITGKLSPKQNEHWYQFNAASSQYVLINLAPLSGTPETANVGILHMPNGAQDGTKGGIIYQGCLPATGSYRLRIARNLMATNNQTAGYIAEIIVLPPYNSQSLCDNAALK